MGLNKSIGRTTSFWLVSTLAILSATDVSSFTAISSNGIVSSFQRTSPSAYVAPYSHAIKKTKDHSVLCMSGGATAAVAEGESSSGGTATIPDEIFNLVKSIVGAGVLSLPAGIAAFGNAPSALLPAVLLISLMGGISGYTFQMMARVCKWSGATSYSDAWDKTKGTRTSWLIAFSSFSDCFLGNLSYSMILADAFRDIFATIGFKSFTRNGTLTGITALVLLPLCLVKNLSTLAPFSLLGIMGMGYTTLAIAFRYFTGAYAPGGKFFADLALQPSFGSTGAAGAFSPKSLILVSMLSTAYIAHFNAPKFYRELKDNTMPRFNKVVSASFGISVAIYAIVASLGFLTFGSAANGLILNNYSTKDLLISLSRFAVAVSLVFSYPLLFVGTRDGVFDMAKIPEEKRTPSLQNKVTFGLLGLITAMAFKLTDLSFVSSMTGATFGTSLIFIYPTMMFRACIAKMGDKASKSLKRERSVAGFIAAVGVVVGIIGSKMALGEVGFH